MLKIFDKLKTVQIFQLSFLGIITAVFPFMVGGYYEFTSFIYFAILSAYLLYLLKKGKKLNLHFSFELICVLLITFGYTVSILWSVDKTMAVMGAVKFLPLLPFSVVLMNTDKEEKSKALSYILYSGVAMTVISGILCLTPLKEYFYVSGGLAGFFQYPNTFAIFLLIGVIVSLFSKQANLPNIVISVILTAGIVLTASRMTLILAGFAYLLFLFKLRSLKPKPRHIFLLFGGALLCVLALVIFKYDQSPRSFIAAFLNAKTVLGRLLYFKDALPQILKHPFGMGYLGYYYTQGSFQTCEYSVMYVHNDFLQLFLDIGWIPGAVFIAVIFKSIFKNSTEFFKKAIIVFIAAHCLFDFDLQYTSIFLILLLCFNFNSKKRVTFSHIVPISIVMAFTVLVSGYFSFANFLYVSGFTKESTAVCPHYTQALMTELSDEKDFVKSCDIAREIFDGNKEISSVYSILAVYEYSQGNFDKTMEYGSSAVEKNICNTGEYQTYLELLVSGALEYRNAGDFDSYDVCLKEVERILLLHKEAKENISPIAYKIYSNPMYDLNDSILTYVDQLY